MVSCIKTCFILTSITESPLGGTLSYKCIYIQQLFRNAGPGSMHMDAICDTIRKYLMNVILMSELSKGTHLSSAILDITPTCLTALVPDQNSVLKKYGYLVALQGVYLFSSGDWYQQTRGHNSQQLFSLVTLPLNLSAFFHLKCSDLMKKETKA